MSKPLRSKRGVPITEETAGRLADEPGYPPTPSKRVARKSLAGS